MMSVSIIMPLYNAGKFLAETLQSVLNQTYRDFELICINDCSTDNTRTILSGFQERMIFLKRKCWRGPIAT